MRITLTARLALDDLGGAVLTVKSFSASLDKRESAALLKACGKPVENLLTPADSPNDERGRARHSPASRVLTGPDGQDRPALSDSSGPVHGQEEGQTPATPLDLILETLRAHGGMMNHDDFRDAVFALAKQRGMDDATVTRVWSPRLWLSRPELIVTETTIAEAKP